MSLREEEDEENKHVHVATYLFNNTSLVLQQHRGIYMCCAMPIMSVSTVKKQKRIKFNSMDRRSIIYALPLYTGNGTE